MLPIIDLNATTLGALPDAGERAARTAVALMLADPFLRVRDALPLLRRAGVEAVANFPTVQVVDGDAARALGNADLGVRREATALGEFRAAGFAALAFTRDLAGARIMLGANPALLVLHPGVPLDDWRPRAAAAATLTKVVEALRAETKLPLLVYRPRGYGAELDRAAEAADGEVAIARPDAP